MDIKSKPKLMLVKRGTTGSPQVIIGGCTLDLIEYSESLSRANGHTISIRFPAEFVEWEKDWVR